MLDPEARPARTLDGLKEALCVLIGSLDRLREALNLKMTFALLCCAIGEVLKAQAPLSPKAEQLALAMFDGKIAGDKLDCDAKPGRVFFDFAFRFELSYVVTCPYSQFKGELDHFAAVTRVRSLNEGKFVILGDSYQVPALPASIRTKPDSRRFRGRLEFSGAIGVGEGEYTIELLVVDEHRRFYRKNWKVRTRRRGGEKKAEVSLLPNQVAPLMFTGLNHGAPDELKPLRLTVLLDAAPVYPFANKLRARDRAFLLGALTSLMRQIPNASVRLVAFNTAQRKEIFQSDVLDEKGLLDLADALRQLELGTVGYKALQQKKGGAGLLNRLLTEEQKGDRRADAVLFLGPRIREDESISRESLSCSVLSGPRLFYLAYIAFPSIQYPDTIERLTGDCKGRVLKFYSAGSFATAIEKVRTSMLNERN